MQRRSKSPPTEQHWRTLGRQPRVALKDGTFTLTIDYAKQKGDKCKLWARVSSADRWRRGGWATEAAALAARPHFKHWVDNEMNSQQRAAQSSSAVARSPASLAAALSPPLPTRVSGRKRPRAVHVAVGLNADGGRVQLSLTLATEMDSSVGMEELLRYNQRARGALQRQAKRRRREIEALGLPEAGGSPLLSEAIWLDIAARCRAAAAQRAQRDAAPSSSNSRPRPRGASYANRVGVKKRARSDRHVQRTEQQQVRLLARVKEAKAYRAAHVKRLRAVLCNDDAASLLRQPDDAPAAISKRQGARATTQCWVVLKTYEEIGRMEEEVLCSGAPVPRGGIAVAAAESAAVCFGICDGETARGWRFEYEQNGGKFELDGRGKWARELLIHEEDLARKFHKWMVATAREEKLSVEAALEYLNGTLLRPPHVTEETLKDYHISLPITNKTAWFWMQKCGAQCGKFAQSYYNDHHESPMVLKDRQERYIPQMDRDERRRPLWVQLPLAAYVALQEATVKAEGALPEGYHFEMDGAQMVELHVDDSNHFEAFRAQHPLGGDFSVRWEGRPRSPPSAPPANLPDPGLDATPTDADATLEPADAAVGVADASPTPPAPPLMTPGAIRALKVAEARDACKALGLSETGL